MWGEKTLRRPWASLNPQGVSEADILLLLDGVCLEPARDVCVLDFVWEGSHSTSPGDLESTMIKAGGSETKKELRVEGATGESLALAP